MTHPSVLFEKPKKFYKYVNKIKKKGRTMVDVFIQGKGEYEKIPMRYRCRLGLRAEDEKPLVLKEYETKIDPRDPFTEWVERKNSLELEALGDAIKTAELLTDFELQPTINGKSVYDAKRTFEGYKSFLEGFRKKYMSL
ncbi:MAG: hypothetical protein DRP15_00580 [Candidatus Aenigmatarchaeota archaeon]|nr:MAG: hypothetical protein DRP15_00580 [Candidatus Aenigmarchaeota archaeon]